jgi:hypothetical protein
MKGEWHAMNAGYMYVNNEWGVMCRIHPYNDGWMLSISPSVRGPLGLDVFFNNIFRTVAEAKEAFDGLITVYSIKENADERT